MKLTRRRFNSALIGAAGLAARFRQAPLRIDGVRLIRQFDLVSQFGSTGDGGIDRVAYSEADRRARAFVRQWMQEAGLSTRIDAAGNLIGAREGQDSARPLMMMGSHLDSVPAGGRFDGVVGAMSAVEAAHTLHDSNIELSHNIEVVVFANEEGGQTGARAMSGRLQPADLERTSHSGLTLAEGIAAIGGDPVHLAEARRSQGEIGAYFELHIEQGPILDEAEIAIGVVDGIVGIHRWLVTVEGFANHAGTTPMDRRQDALLAAARFVSKVNEVVMAQPGRQVGTVGWIDVAPGVPNVVPGRVQLTLEMRDLDWPKIDRIFEVLEGEASAIGQQTKTVWGFEQIYNNPPRLTEPRLQRFIEQACREMGVPFKHLPSGAGHDAQSLSYICPVGMIFVPSRGGISHSPREFTPPEAIVEGAGVLLASLLRADRTLD